MGERKVEGRKDAPLKAADRVVVDPRQDQFFTPDDAEYHRYSELFAGFFEKFSRWQTILAAEECDMSGGHRGFDVLRSKNGSVIRGWSLDDPDLKDIILSLGFQVGRIINITTGRAGRQLLTDPEDHKPLDNVDIDIYYLPDAPSQTRLITKSVTIQTHRIRQNEAFYREASYKFHGDTILEVSNGFRAYDYYGVMTDEMAARVINTIDALIPGTTSPIPQNRRRTTNEQAAQRLLPVPRRRPAGR